MRNTSILFVLMIAGCAAQYAPPVLPPSHPANPTAESAPPSATSRTLALPDADPATPAHDPTPEAPHEHHHGASAGPSSMDAKPPAGVEWIGEMHKAMHDGDVGAKVRLSDLAATPHLSAIGPLAGLKGEITVIDGHSFVATAEAG